MKNGPSALSWTAQHHKEILKEPQGMLTATGNNYKGESANKACLAGTEYHRSPRVKSLTKISSALIRDWQEQKYKNDRRLHKREVSKNDRHPRTVRDTPPSVQFHPQELQCLLSSTRRAVRSQRRLDTTSSRASTLRPDITSSH